MCENLENILDKIIQSKELKPIGKVEKAIHGPPWLKLESGKDLLRLLHSQSDFCKFDKHLQYLGRSGSSTEIKDLADWLVERAIAFGSKQAVDELITYISSDDIEVLEVMLLAAVFINTEYKFRNGVELIHSKSLPNHFLSSNLKNDSINSVIPFPWVTSLLVAPFRQKIVHIINTDMNSTSPPVYIPLKELEEVRLCLVLARPIGFGVHPIAHGTVAPDNLPFINSVSGWSIYPLKQPLPSPEVLENEMKHADNLLPKFSKLFQDFKKKLVNSIERLNGYSSATSEVDRAINLRICLESIFLSDDNKEQLRYTLSLRAALFLGKNLVEKKEIIKLIKDAYDVTSTAVHTGKLPRKKVELLPAAAEIARDAILKLIDQGEVDWQKVELQEQNASD